MSEDNPKNRLELLVPWDLPIEQKLTPTDLVKISRALEQLLAAIKQPVPSQALEILQQTLIKLGNVDVFVPNLSSTKTYLQTWEVKDYDDFFEISHVQTQESAVCLVKSLIIAYKKFLILIMEHSKLDLTQVEAQKQGFSSYVYLLTRVFQLNLEEKNE